MNNMPLVSLCITCYNQQEYIRDSVESALSQNYENLEIIICDDASTDGTCSVIDDVLRNYHGVHRVLFAKNNNRLGVIKNYEKCFKMSHGRYIVTGAGDDISFTHRVKTLIAHLATKGENVTVISHGAEKINKDGVLLGVYPPPNVEKPIGAMMAYDRCVVDCFPDVSEMDAFEDDVFAKRALLLGESLVVDEVLMKYRVGSGVSTSGAAREKRIRVALRCLSSARQSHLDMKQCCMAIDDERMKLRMAALKLYEDGYSTEFSMISGQCCFERLCSWYKYCKLTHLNIKVAVLCFLRFVVRINI